MKVNDFTKLLALAGHYEDVYVTNEPEVHKKAGGIVIAEFQMLRKIRGYEKLGEILSFTIMAGKQAEGIGAPITFRLERPEWFGPPREYSQTLAAETEVKPGRIARFLWRLVGVTKFGLPNLEEGDYPRIQPLEP